MQLVRMLLQPMAGWIQMIIRERCGILSMISIWQILSGTFLLTSSSKKLITTFRRNSFSVSNKASLINQKTFSQLSIRLALKRQEPYYTLTLFVPILVMTLLAPIGLILPGESKIHKLNFFVIFSRRRWEDGAANHCTINYGHLCRDPSVEHSRFRYIWLGF